MDIYREIALPGSGLGPDPGDALVRRLGEWGLRMLLLALAVSPAARLCKAPRLIRFRRQIGLWAFAYAALHFTAYLAVLAGFSLDAIVEDIVRRPYIGVGFSALALLALLAATSTRGWQRRLRARWRMLHRLVYPAALLAWTHLLWLSKGGFLDPFLYGLALALLFGERIAARIRASRARVAR